jgi:hypothetical protein
MYWLGNGHPNCICWECISLNSGWFHYFATSQKVLDFSYHIVSCEFSFVYVQGSSRPCNNSGFHNKRIDDEWTSYGLAWYCEVRKQKWKGTDTSVWPHRRTSGNCRIMVANVDASDSRCRCIVRSLLETYGSWQANIMDWLLPCPGLSAAIWFSPSLGADILGCINRTREKKRKESIKQSCHVSTRRNSHVPLPLGTVW